MENKEKVDILAKRADIINKKVIALLAIDGAIWLYGMKEEGMIGLISFLSFFVVSIAIVSNILKLGDLDNNLKEMLNG